MLHRKNNFPLHIFFRFLKEQKIYKQYRQNLGRGQFNISDYIGEEQFARLVTASFTWSLTPEGHSFWDTFHTIWLTYCAPNIIKIESKKEQTKAFL